MVPCSQTVTYCTYAPLTSIVSPSQLPFSETPFPDMVSSYYSPDGRETVTELQQAGW